VKYNSEISVPYPTDANSLSLACFLRSIGKRVTANCQPHTVFGVWTSLPSVPSINLYFLFPKFVRIEMDKIARLLAAKESDRLKMVSFAGVCK
jgi:hypothetical protein